MNEISSQADKSESDNLNACFARLYSFVGCSAFAWMLVAYISVMALGSPGGSVTPATWILLAPVVAYPIAFCLAIPAALVLKAMGNLRRAVQTLVAPAALGVVVTIYFVVPLCVGIVYVGVSAVAEAI